MKRMENGEQSTAKQYATNCKIGLQYVTSYLNTYKIDFNKNIPESTVCFFIARR